MNGQWIDFVILLVAILPIGYGLYLLWGRREEGAIEWVNIGNRVIEKEREYSEEKPSSNWSRNLFESIETLQGMIQRQEKTLEDIRSQGFLVVRNSSRSNKGAVPWESRMLASESSIYGTKRQDRDKKIVVSVEQRKNLTIWKNLGEGYQFVDPDDMESGDYHHLKIYLPWWRRLSKGEEE